MIFIWVWKEVVYNGWSKAFIISALLIVPAVPLPLSLKTGKQKCNQLPSTTSASRANTLIRAHLQTHLDWKHFVFTGLTGVCIVSSSNEINWLFEYMAKYVVPFKSRCAFQLQTLFCFEWSRFLPPLLNVPSNDFSLCLDAVALHQSGLLWVAYRFIWLFSPSISQLTLPAGLQN